MGWANRVTVARAALAVAVWVLIAGFGPAPGAARVWLTFGLYALAVATDWVDGQLARRFDDVTVFGRIADPLVDKLLILGTLIMLTNLPLVGPAVPGWIVVVLLARELLVTSLRAAVEGRGGDFSAAMIGKVKLTVQAVATGAGILHAHGDAFVHEAVPFADLLPGGPARWSWTHLLMWIALLVTLASAWSYVRRARAALRAAAQDAGP